MVQVREALFGLLQQCRFSCDIRLKFEAKDDVIHVNLYAEKKGDFQTFELLGFSSDRNIKMR